MYNMKKIIIIAINTVGTVPTVFISIFDAKRRANLL